MKTLDLIKLLESLVEKHKEIEDVMGPHEIMIDVFQRKKSKNNHTFKYKGITGNIITEKSSDGVYDILTFGEGWDEDETSL